LLPFKTVSKVAWIEYDTITVTKSWKNNADVISHEYRVLLGCTAELRLLNQSTFRLAFELQKIKHKR
jgi:hypothetical protein